ncbi:hypothetical protein HG535_0A07830 [Zygotorulaspora mrakii]|uniref:Uncharacterized protein n=1 Tax=Zygotorulaspora mrakii TaxID=42260 RepID=A0A7H9AWP8_ZYGMR|nr:uncharacterized protein HG535_0A07830 [Zygotorulaspora mrakii]QLG70840.1 hypothetical protein HG535_0A07830 [Zygotorulaspora mrakii]
MIAFLEILRIILAYFLLFLEKLPYNVQISGKISFSSFCLALPAFAWRFACLLLLASGARPFSHFDVLGSFFWWFLTRSTTATQRKRTDFCFWVETAGHFPKTEGVTTVRTVFVFVFHFLEKNRAASGMYGLSRSRNAVIQKSCLPELKDGARYPKMVCRSFHFVLSSW